MDSLALYRKRTGQPALSLNWGPWSDNGMAATRLTERKVQSRGIRPEEAFHAVETLLDSRSAQAMILPSWLAGRLGEHPASAKQANTFEERLDVVHGEAFESKLSTLQRQPAGQRRRLLKNVVMTQVNLVLASSANLRYAEDTAFFDLGVDSLMAVELRNALTKTLACELSSTLMFDYPTLGTLLDHLDEIAARNDGDDSKREDVAQLSDAEAEEMLMAELKGGLAR
jgi:acyl carrier protein